jgi:hypothetical protein
VSTLLPLSRPDLNLAGSRPTGESELRGLVGCRAFGEDGSGCIIGIRGPGLAYPVRLWRRRSMMDSYSGNKWTAVMLSKASQSISSAST